VTGKPCRFQQRVGLLIVFLGAHIASFSRTQLLDMSRLHNDDSTTDRSIRSHALAAQLETEPATRANILTERGAGYVFSVPVETIY